MVAHANLKPFAFKQGLLGAYQTLYVPERELQVDYESAQVLLFFTSDLFSFYAIIASSNIMCITVLKKLRNNYIKVTKSRAVLSSPYPTWTLCLISHAQCFILLRRKRFFADPFHSMYPLPCSRPVRTLPSCSSRPCPESFPHSLVVSFTNWIICKSR